MSTASNDGDRIAMSQRERDRLRVLHSVLDGQRTQAEAARLLRLSTRQVARPRKAHAVQPQITPGVEDSARSERTDQRTFLFQPT